MVKSILSVCTKLILPASEIHPFQILPNPSWDLSGRLFQPCLCSWLPHGLCHFLPLLLWVRVGRSLQALELRDGLASATAYYSPETCWDSWCPGLSLLCLSCGLTMSLVGQVEITVLGHSCWCLLLSQPHRHIYEKVLFRFYLLIYCSALVLYSGPNPDGSTEWQQSSESGLLCVWTRLCDLISPHSSVAFDIVSCSV